MADLPSQKDAESQPEIYEFRLEGHLSPMWESTFEGLAITLEDCGETTLIGPVIDQAELHSVLRKIRDLGLRLISVRRLPFTQHGDDQHQT
ncbi:MAG: hypothetical protein AAGD96_07930 [Chloroflexota bacterium]